MEEIDIEVNNQPTVFCNSDTRISRNTTSKCKFCGKIISKKNKKRHENQCSKNETRLLFQCPICQRIFSREDKCKEHIQKHEKNIENPSQYRYISCMYDECNLSFHHKTSLIEHLKDEHELNIEHPKVITFNNFEEFEKWKDEEEESSFSYYSKHSGKTVKGDNEYIYFYCQRDTINTSEKSSKRKTDRRQLIGKVKTGERCISMIHLKVKKSGECEVKYFPTHSHPLSIEDWKFQPQSKSVNQLIDQQISLNVSPAQIVQSLKESITNDERDDASNKKLTKALLVTRNLVRLRARKKRIAKQYHEDDASSSHVTSFNPQVACNQHFVVFEEKLQRLLNIVKSEKLSLKHFNNINANIDRLIKRSEVFVQDGGGLKKSVLQMKDQTISNTSKRKLKTKAAQAMKFVKCKRKIGGTNDSLISPTNKLNIKKDLILLEGK